MCVGFWHSQESGFYYLQSRYYDPEICRFINADGLASTGQGFLGTNMFAYCLNNPINGTDSSGNFFIYTINETKTEADGIDLDGRKVYVITINYTRDYYDENGFSWANYSINETVSFRFTINGEGFVSIDNKESSNMIQNYEISLALASEIIDVSNGNLHGRTVEGVAREIRMHYLAYYLDIFSIWETPLKSTDIGSSVIGTDNYDENAIGSESVWKLP